MTKPAPIILWGAPQSLFTGRARSYLIKTGQHYEERLIAEPRYTDDVLPKAGGRRSMPTVELPDGTVIRDSVAIVDHFEDALGRPATPQTPRQRVVSLLFDVIGAEGLLRPAMHYRWNFDDVQLEFLRFHFRTVVPGNDGADADRQMRHIRNHVNPDWGLHPGTVDVTERLYREFLAKFDAHLAHHPYLLGGAPCVGDFGLIAPLYGHLGRDPVPRTLLQTDAVRVFRWVERMNNGEPDTGEYPASDHAFLPDDHVPETLIDLIRHLAIDFVPETVAAHAAINHWLATHDVAAGSECKRYAGSTSFEAAGTTIPVKAQPFRFYLLARVQDAVESLPRPDQHAVTELLEACGMAELLTLRLDRRIGRNNNLEIWL